MTRAFAIISCLIAALFLVPVQAECEESPEYEQETEIECCVLACCQSVSEIIEEPIDPSPVATMEKYPVFAVVKATGRISHIPERLLHCVFRE